MSRYWVLVAFLLAGEAAAASQLAPRLGDSPSQPGANRAAIVAMERRLDSALSDIKLDEHTPSTAELVLRVFVLAFIFAPVLLTAPLAALSGWFCEAYWFGLLARTLGSAGVAFIKWAQWASTRTDLLPEALCHELGALRSGAPEHSARHSRRLVERAVGLALERYFEAFDLRPIASGSIAQVHAARLHGESIAVKVRHPKVVERISTDFTLMRRFAALVSSLGLLKWFDLEETVRQFSSVIGAQTQLQTEARHLRMCRQNFARWPDCVFPRPLLATADVLIETFEAGRHVSDWTDPPREHATQPAKLLLAEPAPGDGGGAPEPGARRAEEAGLSAAAARLSTESRHFVVTRGEDVYLKMLLQDNLMHADLHPGNILLRESQQPGGRRAAGQDKPIIVFVDLGCAAARGPRAPPATRDKPRASLCKRPAHTRARALPAPCCARARALSMVAILSRDEQRNFLGLLKAMGRGDGRAAARHVLAFSDEQPNADAAAFEAEMGGLFERVCRGYGTSPDFGVIIRGVLAAVRTHRVRLGSNYMTLIINALCLDSMARKLQPSYNVLDASKPLLQLHARAPRGVFGALLPFARLVKGQVDASHLRRLQAAV